MQAAGEGATDGLAMLQACKTNWVASISNFLTLGEEAGHQRL
jgi:hypothetical protein